MSNYLVILIFMLLFAKHFIADFVMQGPFQYKNKGTYGHPGGILHVGIQMVATWIVLIFVLYPIWTSVLLVGFIEAIVHYHIDWAKMNINKHFNLGPTTSEQFWWLVGFDQFLHYMCYAIMTAYLISNWSAV